MRTTYNLVVGDRRRPVLPAELRAAGIYGQGSELILIDTARVSCCSPGTSCSREFARTLPIPAIRSAS